MRTPKILLIAVVLILAVCLAAGVRAFIIAHSRPSPATFNRLKNASPEDSKRFMDWLFSQTLHDVRAARGDMPATRAAWIHYFQRGLQAGLSLEELMKHLEKLFPRAQYPDDEARQVLAMLKALTLRDIGFQPAKAE